MPEPIVNLDDMRPHYVIHCDDGPHVVPEAALDMFIHDQPVQGEIPDEMMPVLYKIVGEWMLYLGEAK